MKKVLSILVLALVAVQFAFAGDVITQDTKMTTSFVSAKARMAA